VKKQGAYAVDYDYLMRRMHEERQRAADAETESARVAHDALADQYEAEMARIRAGHNDAPALGLAI
jgi:hypothetical protein